MQQWREGTSEVGEQHSGTAAGHTATDQCNINLHDIVVNRTLVNKALLSRVHATGCKAAKTIKPVDLNAERGIARLRISKLLPATRLRSPCTSP